MAKILNVHYQECSQKRLIIHKLDARNSVNIVKELEKANSNYFYDIAKSLCKNRADSTEAYRRKMANFVTD